MPLEKMVTEYIGKMQILWPSDVNSKPGIGRDYLERNMIAFLSGTIEPSPEWPGRHHANERIRKSGLWNVHYTNDRPDGKILTAVEEAVRRTIRELPR